MILPRISAFFTAGIASRLQILTATKRKKRIGVEQFTPQIPASVGVKNCAQIKTE